MRYLAYSEGQSFLECSVEVESSPSLQRFKTHVMCYLVTWLSGGLVSAGLTAGLHDLKDLFQP